MPVLFLIHLCYTSVEMTIKQTIEQDIKQAMLSGDKTLTETLRGLKSAILNVEVAENKRDQGLNDEEVIAVFQKEAKKRQESADLFAQGGNNEKATAELAEKAVIERYLPAQISDTELAEIIDKIVNEKGLSGPQAMGQAIGAVKQQVGARADGSRIAAAVKERLAQ